MPLTLLSKVPGIVSLLGLAASALQARFLFQPYPQSPTRLDRAVSESGAFRRRARDADFKPGFSFQKAQMSRQSAIETRALAQTAEDPATDAMAAFQPTCSVHTSLPRSWISL